MPDIHVLPSHVADLIAAGEVVERFPSERAVRRGPLLILILGGSEFRLRKFSACGCEFTPDSRRGGPLPHKEERYA